MDTSTADPLVGTVLDGRYRLDSVIARGGMATVFAAFDERLDRPVAVKVMHPALAADDEFVERFRREARSAARLSHPSVVAIYDQGEAAGRTYLVMEHVSGHTLRDMLRERGRLDPARALAVTAGVLTALAAAHAAGLVHRDVKPENVLVTPEGAVKVADFGLARAVETSTYTVADGILLGTVAYLAPEQVVSGAADPRADLYALGVVLFEMLTGAVPFTGDTPLVVANAHVQQDVPDPATVADGVPAAAAEVVRGATRRSVDERYPDAQAMLSAVRRARATIGNTETAVIRLDEAPTLVTTLPPVVPPPTAPVKATKEKKKRRKKPWLVFAIVSLVVLLIAGIAGWYYGTEKHADTPRLVGLERTAALQALRDADLKVELGRAVYDDTIAKDAVAKQDPAPGARVKRGAVVTIQLSLGVKMVKVPDLRNMTEKQAEEALKKADLAKGSVARRYDEKVAKDRVISTSEPPGKTVKHDTKVSLTISDGPAPVTVPDVEGRSLGDAQKALTDAGLKWTVTEEFSDTVKKGEVIEQSPKAAASVPRGSTVALTVSKGPQTVVVPNVVGERIDVARKRLEDLGLRVRVDHVGGGNGRIVLDQDPRAGTEVRLGTQVRLAAY